MSDFLVESQSRLAQIKSKLGVWKQLTNTQRVSLASLLVLLFALPVGIYFVLQPKIPIVTPATPITPPGTPTLIPTPTVVTTLTPAPTATPTIMPSTPTPTPTIVLSPTPLPTLPTITRVEPLVAINGDVVRIYGNNFLPRDVDVTTLKVWLVHEGGGVAVLASVSPRTGDVMWENNVITFRLYDFPSQSGGLTVLVGNRFASYPETFSIVDQTETPTPTPIVEPNIPPEIVTRFLRVGVLNRPYKGKIKALDKDGDSLVIELIGLAPGLELGECGSKIKNKGQTEQHCLIVGKPEGAGIYRPAVIVKDGRGGTTQKVITQIILPGFKLFKR